MAHLSPIHWWKLIWPSVVCASKLGATDPKRRGAERGCSAIVVVVEGIVVGLTLESIVQTEPSPGVLGRLGVAAKQQDDTDTE